MTIIDKMTNEAFTMPIRNIAKPEWDNVVHRIEQIVCDFQDLTIEEMFSKSRNVEISNARFMLFFILHVLSNTNYTNIAKRYGMKQGRIRYAVTTTSVLYTHDKYFKQRMDNVIDLVLNDPQLQFSSYKNLLPELKQVVT